MENDEFSEIIEKHIAKCEREWNDSRELNDEEQDDVLDAPERPQLYCFEHQALPEALFSNHPELIQELYGDATEFPLLHFWSRAELLCMQSGFEIDISDDSLEDAFPFESMSLLKFQNNGNTLFVYTMPEPEFETEVYLVGMLRNDADSKDFMDQPDSGRYFTLERGDHQHSTMLCEWTADRSHLNHGEVQTMLPDAFAKHVFSIIDRALIQD